MGFLRCVFDVSVNEQGVHFGVDILDCNLEAIEAACFAALDLRREVLCQVLINDSVGRSEKGKDVGDEMSFISGHVVPVFVIAGQIKLFCCPEGRLGFLIHFPNLDG